MKNFLDLAELPCEKLMGVGKRMAEKLARLNIASVQDLLFHLPERYQDRTRIIPIRQIQVGEYAVVEGMIETVTSPVVGKTRFLCCLRDVTGFLTVRFFYFNASQKAKWKIGQRVRCFGEVRFGPKGLEMIHPEFHIVMPDEIMPVDLYLTPVYPATEGLGQRVLRKWINQALTLLDHGGVLEEILPTSLLKKGTLPTLKESLCFVHRPPQDAPLDLLMKKKHPSQKRLVFEELLAHRLSLLSLKKTFQTQKAIPLKKSQIRLKKFLDNLSFQLTKAQVRLMNTISHDLEQPYPMLRLLQGDVGSGKTVVSAIAAIQVIENQCQVAVMAPTELLVEQHYATFQKWFEPLGVRVVMLSGQMKLSARNQVMDEIKKGEAHIILGTHALFQKDVIFKNVALIIVDEQHRFGVEQRALLRKKGVFQEGCPHQLMMTATPIPRTLAMSVYADLDYSVIDELPPGRLPVQTIVLSNERRDDVIERIRKVSLAGSQIYWVCTLIEESDLLQCEAAENTATALREKLASVSVGLLHGRMKSAEKEAIMTSFKKGDIRVLVATTVIEVGVDVTNASLMIIENAERLGLSQLHQLRGRVGRGAIASFCVLLYQPPLSLLAQKRLSIMRETNDGFTIAEKDLALRGPGEVLGTRQTGEMGLRIADLIRDSELLSDVQQAAFILIQEYPDVIEKLIRRWLGNNAQYGQV